MKKQLIVVALLAAAAGSAFAGSSSIKLTPPVLEAWDIPGLTDTQKTVLKPATDAAIVNINDTIGTLFGGLETQLNDDYFSQLHDLTQLSRGFANANAASFDNATLNSFQTYDLFAVMVGANVGMALPSTDPAKIGEEFKSVLEKGDIYLGLATGGAAGQAGLNMGLLVKNLYLSAKFGVIPEFTQSFTTSGTTTSVTFKQGMIGVGANYTLFPQIDILFGFIKWRGLSLGTGMVYNANTTKLSLGIEPQSKSQKVALGKQLNDAGVADPNLTATLSDIQADLTIRNSSLVIPVEVATSLQALWFINVGALVGVDIAAPGSQIKLGGGTNLDLAGLDGATFKSGKAVVTATDSKSSGDAFSPRIGASLGLNVAVLKLDIPVSYYPATKAIALGVNAGIVW